MRKPRVALISHSYLEKQYRGKLPVIGQAVDLTVISPDQFPSPYGLRRADFAGHRNYDVRLYSCYFPLPVHTSTRFILASRDLGFRHVPPDIIHIENEESSFVLLQALLYRRWYAPNAKVVVFVWANQPLSGMKGVPQNVLASWARTQVDCYIAGSLEAKSLLAENGVSSDRIAVFPLVGLDSDYYKPALPHERVRLRGELGIAPDEFVIGYVGRFVEDKGIPNLLQAFRLLREHGEGARMRLLCVGDGPLKRDLLTLQPNVLVASPGGSGKVLSYYQVMDVLVLPSRTMSHWKEQFGLVLVEAMACGVPVVGSSSGAIPEVIGDAGLIFHEGDVDELRCRLSDLMRDSALCQTLAAKGQARVTEEYSDLQIADKTLDIYCQLASA